MKKTLDKTRSFRKESLEELRQNASQLMNTADSVSQSLEDEIKNIKNLTASIPGDLKDQSLQNSLSKNTALNKDSYITTKNQMEQILGKLTEDIPRYDGDFRREAEKLTDVTTALISRVNDIIDLTGAGTGAKDYQGYLAKLAEVKGKWLKEQGSLILNLALIHARLKGIELRSCMYSTDPVNLATGNFICQKSDLSLKASFPISFNRFYNAMQGEEMKMSSSYQAPLGRGWNHNYQVYLDIRKETVILHLEDGGERTYGKTEAKDPTEGIILKSLNGDVESLKQTPDGYTYQKTQGHIYYFDKNGNNIGQKNRNGSILILKYEEAAEKHQHDEPASVSPARLLNVSAITGESITLTYTKEGNIAAVSDHTGRRVSYTYKDGNLASATHPDGAVYTYRYDENGYLSETENPNRITTLKNTYDQAGRITAQVFPDSGLMTYAYDDSTHTTTLTERNGAVTKYHHDEQLRNTSVETPDGTDYYTYNDHNFKISHKDKRGFLTRYQYDNKGNITLIINPLGKKTAITYDANNHPLSIKGPSGEHIRHIYDQNGNRVTSEDSLGNRIEVTYTSGNQPESITYPDGAALRLTYDEKGKPVTITAPTGTATHYTYDELNRVIQTKDNRGRKTSYEYDEKDRIISVINPEGNKRIYTYTRTGKVETVTDFDGTQTRIAYNVLNKPEAITDKEGNTITQEYDTMWNVKATTLPNAAIIRNTYDALNRLETTTNPNGAVTSYKYDPNGNLKRIYQPNGGEILYQYDALNRITTVKELLISRELLEDQLDPSAYATTSYTYDASGRITSKTDASGAKTTYTYDTEGRLTTQTEPNGNITAYTYTPLGKINTVTDPLGRTTSHTYLPGGLLKSITYPDGNTVSYHYEGDRVKQVTDPMGNTITYEYDIMDRIIKVESSSGARKRSVPRKSYTYDCMGRVTSQSDTYDRKTTYSYTKNGQLASVTDPIGTTVTYGYDAMGMLISREITGADGDTEGYGQASVALSVLQNPTDVLKDIYTLEEGESSFAKLTGVSGVSPKSAVNPVYEREAFQGITPLSAANAVRKTTYERNLLGQVTAITDPLGHKESYTYDPAGFLTHKTDRDGNTTAYRYNLSGQVDEIRYADETTVKLSYTPLHQLQMIDDLTGTTTIKRDIMGNVTDILSPDGTVTSYQRGSLGERTALLYPDGNNERNVHHKPEVHRINYFYDELSRLTTLQDGPDETHYTYDTYGRLTLKELPNHVNIAYHYNENGQLQSLIHEDTQGILESRQFTYDLEGNKTSLCQYRRDLPGQSMELSYRYDEVNRLISVTEQQAGEDAESNQKGHTEDRHERPVRTFAYDAYGNRIRMTEGTLATLYSYDEANRLTHKQCFELASPIPSMDEGILEINADIKNTDIKDTHILKTEHFVYEYDNRGNLTSIMKNGAETNRYHFDAANRLTEAINYQPTVNTPIVTAHTYNGLGYRTETIRRQAEQYCQANRTMQPETGIIQSEKADTQIHYHQDMLKPYFNLLIRKENGVARHFVWDNHLLSATTAEERAENSNRTWQENPGVMQTQPGQPSQPDRNSNTAYYLQDHQGSPIRIMDDAGMSLTTHAYDEFGNDIFTEEPDTAYTGEESITGEDLFGYTGYQREEDGLYYANARYYDPNAGRFVSEDIIKGSMMEPMSQNPYLYCQNQPMDYMDVDGKNPVALVIILLAVVAGTSGCGTEKEVEVINAEDIGISPGSSFNQSGAESKDNYLIQKAKDQKAFNERKDQCEEQVADQQDSDVSKYIFTTEEQKIFISIIAAEAGGESSKSWEAIAQIIMNRLSDKRDSWKNATSITDIVCDEVQFNGYKDANYQKAYNYLVEREKEEFIVNEKYEMIIATVLPYYYQEKEMLELDGAVLYYSPKNMRKENNKPTVPPWASSSMLEEIYVEGIESNDFRFFKYK